MRRGHLLLEALQPRALEGRIDDRLHAHGQRLRFPAQGRQIARVPLAQGDLDAPGSKPMALLQYRERVA